MTKKCKIGGYCEMCTDEIYSECYPVEELMDTNFNLSYLEKELFNTFKHTCEYDNVNKYTFSFRPILNGKTKVQVKCLCGKSKILSGE